jgi:hypothetical protein
MMIRNSWHYDDDPPGVAVSEAAALLASGLFALVWVAASPILLSTLASLTAGIHANQRPLWGAAEDDTD